MGIQEKLLFLSEQDVLSLFEQTDAITAAEEAFLHIGLGDITVGEMALMYTDAARKNNFHSMPSILHYRNRAGVKWLGTYDAPLPGYPFTHGNLVVLSDIRTGSPIAVMGATNITTMRTAGGHAVVQAKYLANPDPEVLTVMGCGVQGTSGIRGFLTQFPTLRQIRLFSRSAGPMEKIKSDFSERVEVVLCDSPARAIEGSSLILMTTGAKQTLITRDMLRPGMTIIGIEGFADVEPVIGKLADKWYLGYRDPDAYILRSPKLNEGGLLTDSDVFGDMTEVLSGKIPGREREDEIIVSTHMGMGAHDIVCADIIYQRALQENRGTMLTLA